MRVCSSLYMKALPYGMLGRSRDMWPTYHVTYLAFRKAVPSYKVNYTHAQRGKSYVILNYICFFPPLRVVLAVNLSLKQTALVLSKYSQNMLS